jgi:hypothetical protein
MFISFYQIEQSLKYLESVHPFFMITFLVCKKGKIPIGESIEFAINREETNFLDNYFKPAKESAWYYRVSRVGQKAKYWVDAKYASSTLQKGRTSGDLSKAFLHKKDTNLWGWHPDYLTILKDFLQKKSVSAFHLSVWLFREKQWPSDATAEAILNALFSEFNFNDNEKKALFDVTIPQKLSLDKLFGDRKISWIKLQEITGLPPDIRSEGGILSLLEFDGVGPSKKLKVEFSDRINLITGDNGLGKTFLLETAWWALSGSWTGNPIYPREDAKKNEPRIAFQISGLSGKPEIGKAKYDWKKQNWTPHAERQTLSGLLIYARVDSAFAIWDPARSASISSNEENPLVFSREEVWDGLHLKAVDMTRYLCNGLISDWINWQNNPKESPFNTLVKVLKRLSPPDLSHGDLGTLEPGEPKRIPGESRLIPSIRHPYGTVPLIYASASVRRIVALAYLIVWCWEEHKTQSQLMREKPQRKMVILMDEIESHLHPQWQRRILPAILDVVDDLENDLRVQFIITTHSPLVIASMEPRFDSIRDKIFHLNLIKRGFFEGDVVLEEPHFDFRGSADSWLMSELFELKQARSLEAEKAIMDAKDLQMRDGVTKEEVGEVSKRLMKLLPPHDNFWPRWTFFAEKHGVEL